MDALELAVQDLRVGENLLEVVVDGSFVLVAGRVGPGWRVGLILLRCSSRSALPGLGPTLCSDPVLRRGGHAAAAFRQGKMPRERPRWFGS